MISTEGERAIYGINLLASALPRRRAGRLFGTRRRAPVPTDRLMLELCMGRLVGVGEDYLLRRLTQKVRPALLAPTPPVIDGLCQILRKAATNFGKLRQAWNAHGGLDLQTLTQWLPFNDLRQVRHVVVHRLGSWEPGLDPKPTLAARIAALAVDPDRYRGPLPLTQSDFTAGKSVVEGIIDEVEALAP
jgi:hypothetical protein